MDVLKELSYALKDGLGKEESSLYQISVWSGRENSALAYSFDRKQILLLELNDNEGCISGEEYLDIAKALNRDFLCFCVPDQDPEFSILWGGKARGPVHVYKFRVINKLIRWVN